MDDFKAGLPGIEEVLKALEQAGPVMQAASMEGLTGLPPDADTLKR